MVTLLENKDARIRYTATECLGGIGPAATAAVPALLKRINDTNEYMGITIGGDDDSELNIHTQPEIVVPFLIKNLKGSNDGPAITISQLAMLALGKYGGGAKTAVPILKDFLQNGDRQVRKNAADALKQTKLILGQRCGRG